jgi:hypothetical protein
VQALQQYIEGSSYNVWTANPDQPAPPAPEESPDDEEEINLGEDSLIFSAGSV